MLSFIISASFSLSVIYISSVAFFMLLISFAKCKVVYFICSNSKSQYPLTMIFLNRRLHAPSLLRSLLLLANYTVQKLEYFLLNHFLIVLFLLNWLIIWIRLVKRLLKVLELLICQSRQWHLLHLWHLLHKLRLLELILLQILLILLILEL